MVDTPLVAEPTTVDAATDRLLAVGFGDGLPVVPPTAGRLGRMLAGVAEPDVVLGQVPPLFGELTTAAVGYFAVLAGCRPAELPVVLAAVRACLEPEFNLLGVQTTTGTAAVVVVVRGAVVGELGFNPGSNVLGPGNRTNATVGRAVALALAGIGGARPGKTDMATCGQPGRYTFCLPEHPHRLSEATEDGPSVTVLAVGGTAEVVPRAGGATVADLLDPLAELLAGAALAAGSPARMASCEQSVVLPPEVADRLPGSADEVRGYLFERANAALAARAGTAHQVVGTAHDVHLVVSGGAGNKMLHLPGWIGGSHSVTQPILALDSA